MVFLSVCHRRGGLTRLLDVVQTLGAPAQQMLDEGEKGQRVSDLFGAAYLPAMILVDKAGRVRVRSLGKFGDRFGTLERQLAELVKEAGPTP